LLDFSIISLFYASLAKETVVSSWWRQSSRTWTDWWCLSM